MANATNHSNRQFKSTVFTAYFSIPENAALLYQALTGDKDVQPSDIRYVTLEGVLFLARKNDMAFTVRGCSLLICEHQSTLNLNIPLRNVIYYGRTMEKLVDPQLVFTEFNMEDALRVRGEEQYEEGFAQGKMDGKVRLPFFFPGGQGQPQSVHGHLVRFCYILTLRKAFRDIGERDPEPTFFRLMEYCWIKDL